MANDGKHKTWGGIRNAVSPGGDQRSVTVTFNYGGELRTLTAPSRKLAFAEAVRRWGIGWIGEPCVSSPDTIFNDLIGWTRATHGQDLNQKSHGASKRDRYRRSAIGYNDRG